MASILSSRWLPHNQHTWHVFGRKRKVNWRSLVAGVISGLISILPKDLTHTVLLELIVCYKRKFCKGALSFWVPWYSVKCFASWVPGSPASTNLGSYFWNREDLVGCDVDLCRAPSSILFVLARQWVMAALIHHDKRYQLPNFIEKPSRLAKPKFWAVLFIKS